MARNKEGLVLLLDVGPSMHGVLQEVENVCSTLVRKKLVYNRSDEVGVVLFGTKETCNDLAKELGGYKHVVVKHDIKVVDEGTTVALQDLPRGTAAGDFLDAIVVGLDMLIKRFGNTKGKQRLCLITDAQHPLRDPPQGTKEDQVDTIAEQMKRHDIKMDCIVFRESGVHHNSVMDENDQLLYRFRDRSVAKVVQVDSPTSLLGALKTRNVLPVTVFRGDLEVSSNFKIKVWVYKKTSEEKFPTLKKYSDKAPPSDKFASHEVKVDYEYKSVLEPDTVVPPDQRIKGYHYGPQVVPISSAEWEAVKFKPEKGVKLLGFADRSSILRHYFMKDVYSFIPEPGNTKATVAVSAIARAMQETNKAAILRCIWRQGQGNVAFGVLTPNISSVNSAPDSFYFNILPFAEDIREFQFRSFSSLPSSSQPTEEQQEAADNLVKMLDLAPPGREEILRPDFTPNPMLERFYNFLHLKSKQPDANVPPLDRCLRRITEPDPDVIDQAPLIKNLGKAFELKENPKKKKARTQERLTYTGADDQPKFLEQPSAEKVGKMENLYPPTEKVGKIGDLNPVQDFEAMLTERSSSTWVQKAIEEMQKYTTALLENSREGDDYQKALECFVALRKACIIEQEPEEFNRFLTKLYERLRMVGDVAKFFQLLSSKNVSLISKEEAPDRWTEHLPMSPVEGCPTVFQAICSLSPGIYQYKFFVDGEWRHDERQPTITGDYGVVNTLYVTREFDQINAVLSPSTPGSRMNMDVDNENFQRMVSLADGALLEGPPRISEAAIQISRCRVSEYLNGHTGYDLLPDSGKVIALDINLPVKQSFHILHEQGIPVAPLWDSFKGQFVGLLSPLDFILILRELETHGSNLTEQQLETHTISAWKEAKRQTYGRSDGHGRSNQHLVHATPYESLRDIAMKILQTGVSTVPIIFAPSSDGSFPQLLHLASLSGILKCICRYFKNSTGNLPILNQPVCTIPLGTWVPKIGDPNGHPLAMLRPNASLSSALDLLVQAGVSSIPIVDDNDSLLDTYSRSDITALAKDKVYTHIRLDDMTIHQALQLGQDANSPFGFFNGQRCHMCLRSDSLLKVMERLANPGVCRVFIVEAGSKRVEGIISPSDIFKFLLS